LGGVLGAIGRGGKKLVVGAYDAVKRWLGLGRGAPEPPLCGSGLGQELLHGTGPAPGVIEVSERSKSVGVFKNYTPPKNRGAIEYVFDPESNTFLVGQPKGQGWGHTALAELLGKSSRDEVIIAGELSRGPNGEVILNNRSGHYWRNWTPAKEQQMQKYLSDKTGLTIIVQQW
jgi:hypothetical protein